MNDTEFNKTSLFGEDADSFELYTFQLILHPIALCICVPLNLFVGYVLLSDKELHNARNAIWLGVVASNLAAFFMDSLQQFVFYRRSYAACQVFSFLAGKPYVVLLVNLLLATCDRFIYTSLPRGGSTVAVFGRHLSGRQLRSNRTDSLWIECPNRQTVLQSLWLTDNPVHHCQVGRLLYGQEGQRTH